MKKQIIIFLTLLCCVFYMANIFAVTENAKVTPIDRVVAIVNNDVITEAQLTKQINIMKNQMQQANMQIPPDKILRKKILQQLIDQLLQVQIAKSTGIRVSNHQLNAALHRLAAQRKISVSDLYKAVQKAGWTIQGFRKQIREQIAIEELQRREVASRISISEQEVNDYLHAVKSRDKSVLKEYHLQNILIPLPDSPSPEQIATAKQQAQDIMQKLAKGADFNKIAMTQSGGKRALQGGDLGWRKIAELPVIFAEKVKNKKEGTIIGPISTPNGIHVLKLLGVRALQSQKPIGKKEVEQMIWQRKVDEQLAHFVNSLRSQSYIKILD